ncbi:replication protein P [Aquitalea aquatica]|uniref:Uncharacterized protein n=1 Tax=Aquitalea aquatica TaxID=3044273 RepID=A0A838YDD4_9NEIS|nr:replication protein P [Aquitalea magnusonii]MBA4710529.1 hypothetical protein [Aquitalea magnusonii]
MDSLTPSMANAAAWTEPRNQLDGLALIDHLYNQMDGMYPNLWRANFKGESAIANWRASWLEAFVEEGITPLMAATGIKVCRREHDMPPSLPKFLKACRGGESAPDAEALYYRAATEMGKRRAHLPQSWPSPALYWAAVAMGGDILTSEYRHVAGRWKAALDANRSNMAPIPDVAPDRALPAPKMDSETAKRRMAELGGAVKGFNHGEGRLKLDCWKAIADETERGVYPKAASFCQTMAAEVLFKHGYKLGPEMLKHLPAKYRDEETNPMEAA